VHAKASGSTGSATPSASNAANGNQ